MLTEAMILKAPDVKENHIWFYEKRLRRCEESSLKHIVLPNEHSESF